MQNGIPDTGDIIRMYIGPSKGNEQDGYRALLVISDYEVNEVTGRVMGMPITSTRRGWATEIPIDSLARPGVALVDQLGSWSYLSRDFKFDDEQATEDEVKAAKYAIREFLQL